MGCKKCGLCCRKLIIDDVYEVDLVREPRLKDFVEELTEEPGRFLLKTPCPFLINNQCSIYPTRPDICVSYAYNEPCIRQNREAEKRI